MNLFKMVVWFFLFAMTNSHAMQTNFQETDFTKPIVINKEVGQFKVSLWSTPGTGYLWRIKSYDSSLIVPVSKTFERSDAGNRPGSPGLETFTFIINKTALDSKPSTRLVFIYVRPWNKEVARTVTYKLIAK